MRKINTKFFAFLVVTAGLSAGAIFGLHRLQASNLADALLWQARQAEKDGKLDRAAKYLGRYLEFQRDDLSEREHLGLILSDPDVAITPQRRARARFVLEQVLVKDPQRFVLRQRLARLMIASRALDIAKEHLNYLEKNQPANGEVPYLVGQWHEAQNQTTPALTAYRRAIKADPNQVNAHLRLILLLKQADFGRDAKHAEEIERLVVTVLEKSPHDPGVLSLAAQHAQEKGNTRIALNYLEDGLQHSPTEPRLYLALAQIHRQNGKRTEAIEKLQLGLTKVHKEERDDLRWSLANLLIDENRQDEARKLIGEIRDGNKLSADYLEARWQMRRGRWFEAAKQFEKVRPALKTNKELAFQTDLQLGTCYEQMEEPVLQLTAYQRAAELDPTSSTARRGMANAHWALGQAEEALRIAHGLAGRAKDSDEAAKRRLDFVRMSLQAGQRQNLKDSRTIEQELDEIEKVLPKSLDVALLRAELIFLQGDKAKADQLLNDAIKAHPNRCEPWLALIAFASAKNDVPLARRLLGTAEERFKDQAEFRLAQIRFWAAHYGADAATFLKGLETSVAKFKPREQSRLLQAMAEAHYFASKYAEAFRALKQMSQLPLHQQDLRVRMQMLEVALLQDDDTQARAILADIKRIEGDANGGIDYSFGEAVRLIHEGKQGKKDALEKARHLLTVAAAQRPNWHPIIQTRAELDELQGRPDQAIANYDRAIKLGCRDPQAMKQLIVLLSQAHRYDEVEQVLQRMQKQNGTTEELVRYYVHNSFNRREFARAEYLARKIVATNSNNYRDHLWLGQILSSSGQNSGDAEKAFRRAAELAPRQPEAWINLVRHLVSGGNLAAAKSEIDQAGKAVAAERKDLTIAVCFELLGALREAAESYEAAVKAQPSVATLRAAGDFLVRLNHFEAAEVYYRKVMEHKVAATDQDLTAVRRSLAFALAKQNQPTRAAEALHLMGLRRDDNGVVPDAAIADHREERIAQAKVLGAMNHHRLRARAIALLETMQQQNALSADDQFFLARLHVLNQGDAAGWPKTRALLKALTQQNPKNVRYLASFARRLIARKEFTQAEQAIAKLEAIERERKVIEGGFGSIELRASLLEMRGLGNQAVALLKSYAEQPGAAPMRKLLVASLQGRLGNFREAIDWCEEVRKVPELANDAGAAAVGILRLNRPSEAQPTKFEHWQRERARVESMLRETMQRDPKDLAARMFLADLMELQGNYGEVEKLCRETLKINDTHLVALNNLAWLLGQRANKANEALTLINRAIDKHGPRPELLDTRAIVQLNLGNSGNALRDLERVVNEAPTPTRLFHLARAHERLKNITSAVAMLRQATDQGLTAQQLHPIEQPEFQRVTQQLRGAKE